MRGIPRRSDHRAAKLASLTTSPRRGGALALNDYARSERSLRQCRQGQVAIEISSVIRASPSSFHVVAWIERRYQDGSLATTERWSAILTVAVQPPRDIDRSGRTRSGSTSTPSTGRRNLDATPPLHRPAPTKADVRLSVNPRSTSPDLRVCARWLRRTIRRPTSTTTTPHPPFRRPILRRSRSSNCPEALPLPGQLGNRSVRDAEARTEAVDPTVRVNQANAAALVQPVRNGFINSMQVYPALSMARSIGSIPPQARSPTSPCSRARPSSALAPSLLATLCAGSSATPKASTAAGKQVHILVKPTRP